jgi:hypothetical protein
MKEPYEIKVQKITTWKVALNCARATVNKEEVDKEPSAKFVKKILLAEHSPIRTSQYLIKIGNLPSWISQHIARHDAFASHTVRESNGDTHFVGTSRTDRTGIDRTKLPQDAPVSHTIYCNANDLINISRRRLCRCASPETKRLWEAVKYVISLQDLPMASVMVRECVYRGFCPETDRCCGYVNTEAYKNELEQYRKI